MLRSRLVLVRSVLPWVCLLSIICVTSEYDRSSVFHLCTAKAFVWLIIDLLASRTRSKVDQAHIEKKQFHNIFVPEGSIITMGCECIVRLEGKAKTCNRSNICQNRCESINALVNALTFSFEMNKTKKQTYSVLCIVVTN